MTNLTYGAYTVIGTGVVKPTAVAPPALRQKVGATTEEERTFFVARASASTLTLILHHSDPRRSGMWPIGDGEHLGWSIAAQHVDVTPFPDNIPDGPALTPTENALQTEVRKVLALEGEIATLRRQLAKATEMHAADIERIGDRFLAEAEDRDWCEEYDEVITDLNRDLAIPLKERERTWEVVLDVQYRVTITVDAPSQKEAEAKIEDNLPELSGDAPDDFTIVSVSHD